MHSDFTGILNFVHVFFGKTLIRVSDLLIFTVSWRKKMIPMTLHQRHRSKQWWTGAGVDGRVWCFYDKRYN